MSRWARALEWAVKWGFLGDCSESEIIEVMQNARNSLYPEAAIYEAFFSRGFAHVVLVIILEKEIV
jgi:hypothetical protein